VIYLHDGGAEMDVEKLVQLAAYILKKYNGTLNYTKLIKLLYLADRKSIETINRSMTEDKYVALRNGPVLSDLYNLIKGTYSDKQVQSYWDARFTKNGYDLVALSDRIPDGKLSRFEKQTIDSMDSIFHDMSYTKMIDFVHDKRNCPEWHDTGDTSEQISEKDILQALGFAPGEITILLKEAAEYQSEEKIFSELKNIPVTA
jgi:uncharacterized phage-associated protein